jgi:Zn-dependent M28 family amino/carboxypeptidase
VRDQKTGTSKEAPAIAWAVAAFRDAGVEVHTEKYSLPVAGPEGESHQQENVVAEIRGREKPDEWVLLGAHLDSSALNSGAVDEACNAALVIEAARDIQLTGVRPRRSIRFVLFGGRVRALIVRPDAGRSAPLEEGRRTSGSWTYLRAHHDELDRARAAILFDTAANRVNGFALNGRRDIESSVRETLKPIGPMGVTDFSFNVPLGPDSFDFLLEGIPAVVAATGDANEPGGQHPASNSLDNIDIKELKRNTAIAAVTAFGVAERAAPLGPRQSRAEIESLLITSGLEQQMKITGLWPLWESGERGRLP